MKMSLKPSNWPALFELLRRRRRGDVPLGPVLLSVVKAWKLLSTGGYVSAIDASNVWIINY